MKGRRSEGILSTKFGNVRSEGGKFLGLNGRADYVKEACAASLHHLGTDYIDLYYVHRVDPNTPIEETVGAMSELVREIGFVAFSPLGYGFLTGQIQKLEDLAEDDVR